MSKRPTPHDQLKLDLKAVLALPQGRRYLNDLLERCGIGQDIWSPSAEIHRKAGMQFIGLSIIEDIRAVQPELVEIPLIRGIRGPTDEDDSDA